MILEIDFTENLRARKILIFPHCVYSVARILHKNYVKSVLVTLRANNELLHCVDLRPFWPLAFIWQFLFLVTKCIILWKYFWELLLCDYDFWSFLKVFFAKKVQFYKNCIIWSYSLVGDYFDVWHFVRNSKSLNIFFQMEDSFSKRKLANANEDKWENARIINFCLVKLTQCGNFRVFLLLRFYVKSIFGTLEILKVPFWQFQRFWS